MYPHGDNLQQKIITNYKGLKDKLEKWKEEKYLPWSNYSKKIDWSNKKIAVTKLTKKFESYLREVRKFTSRGGPGADITTQSLFESSVMEEFCYYLFRSLPLVNPDDIVFTNKNVFIGLSISPDGSVQVHTKDSDFCIARHVETDIGRKKYILNVPLVTVECKSSYVDKTMLSGLMHSARLAKQGAIGVRCYIIAETKNFVMSLHDSPIDEVFILKRSKKDPFDTNTVFDFYLEVWKAIESATQIHKPKLPGRAVNPGFSLADTFKASDS